MNVLLSTGLAAALRRVVILASVLILGGCHFSPMAMLAPHSRVEVQEVWRSQFCNAPDAHPRAFLFAEPQAFRSWAAKRQLQLPERLQLDAQPHALVEQGLRNTGGYGLAISRDALIRGDRVIALHGTFLEPGAGRMRAQVLTSPCALVRLPAGTAYRGVLVYDENDRVVADSNSDPAVQDSWLPFQ